MTTTRTFWIVTEGDATVTDDPHHAEWDGDESVLVFATGAQDAIRIAGLYDDGAGGVTCNVYITNPETGDYDPVACIADPAPLGW